MTGLSPPPDVTASLFGEWRNARRGQGQADQLDNPLWAWLIANGLNPYTVNEHFGGTPSNEAGPGWTNDRFGQSSTPLPDGRVVLVGGEHEDYYDPDFYIYNDVIVQQVGAAPKIFGYGIDVFAPTDFHTATLIGDQIVLIGSLGYQDERRPGETQLAVLDTTTWHINQPTTSGSAPGWIHNHVADLMRDRTIRVSGGLLVVDHDRPGHFVENHDDWLLDLDTFSWSRATERAWQQWQVVRSDRGPSELWRHRTQELASGRSGAGSSPLAELYRPPVPHSQVRRVRPEEFNVFRIDIVGTTVRYVEDMGGVRVVVEGELSNDMVDEIIGDLRSKLEALESCPCSARRLA